MGRKKIDDLSGPAARFVLVGGFLGAGKTTLIGRLAGWLAGQGLRVGLVANDQGRGLLDTASAWRAVGGRGTGVEEITGGCFCCRFGELVGAIGRLEAGGRPDVIVAEPVGSCTDVVATVLLPLERIHGLRMALAPLSVVLDGRRALAALGGRRSARDFHRDVGYVYRKQMEEAEWLVVNKVDLLEEGDLPDLLERLGKAFSGRRLFVVSGKTGDGLVEWFGAVMEARSEPAAVIEVDYARYADGEALLGWVNSEASCELRSMDDMGFDWGRWLAQTGGRIATVLDEERCEVGHFKMSVETGGRRWRLHQTMSGEAPVLIEEGGDGGGDEEVRLLVNLRAEGDAKRLEEIVDRAFAGQPEVAVEFRERAAFQPGKPQPTHRVAAV